MLKKIGLLVVSSISVFAMNNAEVNINDKDLELGLGLDLGQYNGNVKPDTTFIGVKYLKASNNNANRLINTKYFLEFNFLIKQEIQNTGLKVGLGVKTNFSAIDGATFISVPLGLDLSYTLPLKNFIPIEISAKAYYAPQSLSFSDASSFKEYRAGIRAEVISRGSIFVGYRNIDTNYEIDRVKHNVTYNRSAYFGFKFEF